MAFNKNKKIVTTALTAAMVASAVAPVAAAKLTPAQDASKAVDGYYKLSVKTRADVSNSAKIKKAALAKVAKLGKKDAKLKASLTAKINKKSAAINKYYYTVIVPAEKEAAAIKAVEAALKIASETPITAETTKEQVEAAYAAVIKLIDAVKTPAKKTEFKAAADKMKEVALAKIEELATPKVSSVTAINGGQLLVKFNKAVDETTATTVGNYTFSDLNTVKAAGAELQEDGKSVLLSLTTPYSNASSHSVAVTVQNIKVDGTVDSKFPVFTQVVAINDTAKPEVSSVSAVTNADKATSITVNFSEPIASGASFKVDGVSASAPYAAGATSVTVSIPSGLAVGVSHKVEVVNVSDLSGNVSSVASKEFTVTKDVAAPTVSSVVAQGDNQLLVTFSKNMKNDAAAQTVLANNIKVKNDVYGDINIDSVTPVDGTSKTQFVVQLNKTNAATLFSATKLTHNLTILFVNNTIEDYLGNKLTGVTTTASVTKDTVAPEVTGVTYKKNSAGKVTSVVVNFNEGLKANGALAFPTSLVNENGVVVTTSSVLATIGTANVATGAKSATFTLATPQTVTGKYTVAFGTGFVKDTSLVENDSKAYTTVVDFGATQTSGEFTIPAANVTTAGSVIKVVFPEAVKGGAVEGSATDVSRYTINGKALPAGTTITLNAADVPAVGTAAQTIATITLPGESISTTDTAAIFTVNGVKSLTGKTNVAFTKAVQVTDNVKPVLNAGVLTSDNKLSIGFSESLTVAPVAADLVVKVNGLTLTATGSHALTVTPGTGSDAGKYLLNLNAFVIAGTDAVAAVPGNDGPDNTPGTPDDVAGTPAVAATPTFVDVNNNGTYDVANDIKIGDGLVTGFKFSTSPLISAVTVSTLATGTSIALDAYNNSLANGTVVTAK